MELKRLGFVLSYLNWGIDLASSTYSKGRSYTPKFVEGYVSSAEDAATSYGAPVYNQVQDLGSWGLEKADSVVDSTLTTLTSTLDYSRDLHNMNMKSFYTAKDTYFSWLDSGVQWVKATINPYPYVQWAVDTAWWTLDKIVEVADPDKLVDGVAKVSTYPPVAKVLEVSDPVIKPLEMQYMKGHDYLVANPTYQKLYTNVEKTIKTTSSSPLYRRARDTVWPVAEPVAGPLYDNFARSKYLAQLADHLKPKIA